MFAGGQASFLDGKALLEKLIGSDNNPQFRRLHDDYLHHIYLQQSTSENIVFVDYPERNWDVASLRELQTRTTLRTLYKYALPHCFVANVLIFLWLASLSVR